MSSSPDSAQAQPTLVGESREALSMGLDTVWNHVQASSTRVWLSLEGEPGIGKTRVVHEFYSRLAGGQTEPHYWPNTVHGDMLRIGPRKVAGPLVWERPPQALPDYLWLGFSGRRGDGVPEAQLAAELRQLDEHFPLVQRAAGQLSLARALVSELGEHVRGMTVEEVATRAVEGGLKLVGAQIPGVSHALSIGEKAFTRYRQERALTERIQSGEDIQLRAVAGGAIDEFIQRVTFAASFMGVVVFVEDVHQCHPILIEALKRLLAEDHGRLLVITSEWEVGQARLAEAAHSRWISISHSGVTSPDPDLAGCFDNRASLAPLTPKERIAFIHQQVPEATSASAEALADEYENLQMLGLVCSLNRTREALARSSLDPSMVQALPRKVEQFLDESWSELSDDTRAVLIQASCLAPASIEETAQGVNSHFDERIALSLFPNVPSAETVTQARRLHWLESAAEGIDTFVDKQRRRLALREAIEEAITDHRWRDLAQRTHEPDWQVPDTREGDGELVVRDGVTVALARAGYSVDVLRLLESCYRLVVDLRDSLGDIPIVAEVSETAVATARAAGLSEEPLALLLTEAWARALAERGEPQPAMVLLQPLIDDPPTTLGQTQRLRIEWLYARIERSVGSTSSALARLQEVAVEQETISNASGDLLRTRADIAFTHAAKGEYGTAQWILQEVLDNTWESDAVNDVHRTEHQMASVLRRRGDLTRAYPLASQLLERQRERLGRTHPDVLATQQLLVATLRDRGLLSAAMDEARILVELRTRILGNSQPTREAQSHMAWLHRKLGEFDQGAQLFKELAAQSAEIDSDHWTTLRDLHNYAVCRRDGGNFDEAIELLSEVQARAEQRDRARIAIIETVRERGRSHLFRHVRTGSLTDLEAGHQLLSTALKRAREAKDMSQPMRWQLEIDAACARSLVGGWTAMGVYGLADLCRRQLTDLGAAHPEVLRSTLYLAQAHQSRGRDELAIVIREDVARSMQLYGIDSRHSLRRLIDRGRAGTQLVFI